MRETNKQQICNEFKDFFYTNRPKISWNIERLDLPNVSSFMRDKTTSTLLLKPTGQDGIKSIVLKCKSKNSDNLSMYLIQHTINSIAKHLTCIFNMSFKTGRFTSKMKLAKIILIFKKAKKLCI